MQQLIDGAVVLGFAAVAPLALGWWRWWLTAAVFGVVALWFETGLLAGVLALPAIAVAVSSTLATARDAGPLLFWRLADTARALGGGWATVAAGSLVASRLGLEPFGIQEPIVELTAVHYLYAGTGAITLAGATGSRRAVAITAAAPPIVAAGFVTRWAAPQVGGAALMALGVLTVAAFELHAAADTAGPRRALLAVSGLAVWAPMALALAWAAGQHWDVPALSVPDMVRWHGLPNALGFVLAGLLAIRVGSREERAMCD